MEKKDCSGKGRVDFSEEELRLFEGNILIHSHGKVYGGRTFTESDINSFLCHRLREMRMVRGNVVKALVHAVRGDCDHSGIVDRLREFKRLRNGDPESMMEKFLEELLYDNPCLSTTERTVDP
jgi:hypothetical protein